MKEVIDVKVEIPSPHSEEQARFIYSIVLRQMIKSGRRFGKTVGAAIKSVLALLGVCPPCQGKGCLYCKGTGKLPEKRVLYTAPTAEQVEKYWFEVTQMMLPLVNVKRYIKNETEKFIEKPGTEERIKAKTAWNANTLRGDYGDLLIFDEFQLTNESAWEDVGAPMLLDNNGTAVFIFTPPSLKEEGVSKARDPRHASKMFKKYSTDTSGKWETFHFTSMDNPLLSKDALAGISEDMSADSYRREILAIDDELESSWLLYGMFDSETCKIKRFTIPKHWPVYSGHDFGTANPAALFVAEVKLPLPEGAPKVLRYGDYVAFAEYSPGAGFSLMQHVDAFKRISLGHTMAVSVGGNVTTEEEIRQGYGRAGWRIRPPSILRVNSQIDRAIQLIERKQFCVFDDLYNLLGQISNCMWIIDEEKRATNKVKDEARYHLLACLRYLATVLSVKATTSVPHIKHWDEPELTEVDLILRGKI